MKKYLVTGATSMLGSELVNELSKNDIIYAIIRRNSTKISNIIKNKNIILLEFNMYEYKDIKLDTDSLDGVFHFAWEGARNPERNDETIQKNNFDSSVALYNVIKKYNPKFFVGIGSQGEYGNYEIPYSEELSCKPETWYGKYKNMLCEYLNVNCHKDGIRFIWPRVFSAYGSKDFKNTLLMSSIKKMMNDEIVDVSPCIHTWTFTYYKDVIKGILLLVNSNCNGIYNVSNSDNIPLKDYIIRLKDIIKSKSILNFGYYKYNNNIVPNMIVDNRKLVRDTGYHPDFSFEDGIREILEDIKNDN